MLETIVMVDATSSNSCWTASITSESAPRSSCRRVSPSTTTSGPRTRSLRCRALGTVNPIGGRDLYSRRRMPDRAASYSRGRADYPQFGAPVVARAVDRRRADVRIRGTRSGACSASMISCEPAFRLERRSRRRRYRSRRPPPAGRRTSAATSCAALNAIAIRSGRWNIDRSQRSRNSARRLSAAVFAAAVQPQAHELLLVVRDEGLQVSEE